MAAIASSPAARSARLGLRATPEQEVVLRRAAEVAHKSLMRFHSRQRLSGRRADPAGPALVHGLRQPDQPRHSSLPTMIVWRAPAGSAAAVRRPWSGAGHRVALSRYRRPPHRRRATAASKSPASARPARSGRVVRRPCPGASTCRAGRMSRLEVIRWPFDA